MKNVHIYPLFALASCLLFPSNVLGALAARRFDVCTWQTSADCTPNSKHFLQAQLDELNWVSANGHFIAMPSATHRDEINANGNFMAVYYNDLDSDYYNAGLTGAQEADAVESYIYTNFDAISPGSHPQWVILNEIPGAWPDSQSCRTWVVNVVQRLHQTYGHAVIVASRWPNPVQNGSDWQAVAANGYIAIENYLSGAEVNASGNSVSYCQNIYQSSINSYVARGVSASKLYLIEHFGQTLSGSGFGRAGVSSAGWDNAINARITAAHNCGFAGFVSYGWSGNDMGTCESWLVHYEDTYNNKTLP